MEFKINPILDRGFTPSANYYKARKRFENILQSKMNIFQNQDIKNNKENDDVLKSSQFYKVKENNNLQNVETSNNNITLENNKSKIYKEVENIFKTSSKFSFDDIRKKSKISASEIDEILKNTRLKGLGKVFKEAEKKYNVNALILLSMAKLESNFGESKIAKDKNNLFGMGAYDRNPYKYARKYDTFKDSIFDVANHLSKNYLQKGAPYFKGYSIDDVNKYYCTDLNWSSKIKAIAQRFGK